MSTVSTTGILVTRIDLTNSEFTSIAPGSPLTLLPAPGTGLMYNVLSVDWIYNYGTTVFTTYGGALFVTTKDVTNALQTKWAAQTPANLGVGNAYSTRVVNNGNSGYSLNTQSKLSDFSDQPLMLGADTSQGYSMSGGDGTLSLIITYCLVED